MLLFGQACFYFGCLIAIFAFNLMIDLAISSAMSMALEVAIGLLR